MEDKNKEVVEKTTKAQSAAKEEKVETVTSETAKPVEPNNVTTHDQFAQSNILDILALNNELNSKNEGELTFKVIKQDYFSFPATDDDNQKIEIKNPDGSQVFDDKGEIVYEMVHIPYVEIAGSAIKARLTTKHLSRDDLEKLNLNETYYATYVLTADEKLIIKMSITSVSPLNQELQSRVSQMAQLGQ